jgi:parallel beta-helix repeat protein
MKKKIIGMFVCMLLIAVVLPVSGKVMLEKVSNPVSVGDTLYVGGSGPNNYTTIQSAIDDAVDGDTVFVFSGTYNEHLIVDVSINLIGENKETTVIDGNEDYGNVVHIRSEYVTLTGFTIRNSGSDAAGVWIRGEYNSIIGNIITRNRYGIFLFGVGWNVNSDYNEIIDNIISNNNGGGIRLENKIR